MSVDAVLSYHTNPYRCGVAKFNIRLARELGVPFASLLDGWHYRHPLVSIKPSERPLQRIRPRWECFDLFLHGVPTGNALHEWWRENHPMHVYAANAVIARELRQYRPDVIEAWCPSTVETPPARAALTVLTFGMAHKLVSPHYLKLKALLEVHGEPYTILLSTGVHEGSPWDEALEASTAALRGIFGERLEVLGFLSDAALDREIRQATACAAFYDPALRANNTTAFAVLERRVPLFTNLDVDSPDVMVYDIQSRREWPDFSFYQDPERCLFRDNLVNSYRWENLLKRLAVEVPCAS